MQVKRLRSVLQQVVLASLPLAAGCDTSPVTGTNDCIEHHATELNAPDPNSKPDLQFRIDSCRVDVDACIELCGVLMSNAQVSGNLTTCNVSFEGDEVHAAIAYDVMTAACGVGTGRRPDGLARPRYARADSAAGAWLARAAWLEASSIYAFVRLARELRGHDAPRALVRLAEAAARDEVRHAALMTRLARRFGGEPPTVEVAPPRERTLEALAIENAVEGCVGETWGAVVAMWQAQRASDVELRAAFASIARDEVRHAALGWAIDRWANDRLDDAARTRVARAKQAAVDALAGVATEEILALGLPSDADARRLHAQTVAGLWNGGLS